MRNTFPPRNLNSCHSAVLLWLQVKHNCDLAEAFDGLHFSSPTSKAHAVSGQPQAAASDSYLSCRSGSMENIKKKFKSSQHLTVLLQLTAFLFNHVHTWSKNVNLVAGSQSMTNTSGSHGFQPESLVVSSPYSSTQNQLHWSLNSEILAF